VLIESKNTEIKVLMPSVTLHLFCKDLCSAAVTLFF